MGYDMRWVRRPDGEAEAVEEARRLAYAAADRRDTFPRHLFRFDCETLRSYSDDPGAQAALDECAAAFADLDAADRSYFRLNISGMSWARGFMAERGMLCDPPHDPWPDYPLEDGYRAQEWVKYPEDREGDPPPAEDLAIAEKYVAEMDAVRRCHPGECPGIPAFKLGSNDSWVVLPAECKAALVALEAARENGTVDPDASWWPDWVAWVRDAIEHDGFVVR